MLFYDQRNLILVRQKIYYFPTNFLFGVGGGRTPPTTKNPENNNAIYWCVRQISVQNDSLSKSDKQNNLTGCLS